MKKIAFAGGFVVVLAIAAGLFAALKFGEQSALYAEGVVTLAPELEGDAKGMRTLFVTVFDAESQIPMPYGAMRETLHADAQGEFQEFFITPERMQIMNPSAPLPKVLRIKARLDQDGQGGMDQPGDLVGEVENVAFGAKNVRITISRKM